MVSGTKIIMIGEIGTDADEAIAAILACYAVRAGHMNLLAFVGNHVQSLRRAQNAKQIFTALGLADVPVGMGERGFGSTSQECEEDPRFLAHATKLGLGRSVLQWTLQHSEDQSVTLALNSGFTDATWLWMDDASLFLRKVKRVVIMGGIKMEGGTPKLSSEGFLVPSIGKGGAANNNFDPGSTQHLYDAMQRNGVPIVITTRFAAYGCKMPFGVFGAMTESGSAIGARIGESQRERIQELWLKANAPVASFQRGDLPERCDRTWFVNTFCDGRDPGEANILPYMAEVAWYDPINLIASSDELRTRFFNPYTVEVKGVKHEVIGLSEADHCISSPEELRRYMADGVIEALRLGQTPIPVV